MSPLARALPAMTALQAIVAMGTFSMSVLAPQLGLSVAQLAALNTVLFTTGAVSALLAGRLLARFGDWPVAAMCAGLVAAGMVCLGMGISMGTGMGVGGAWAPWLAVLCLGLAFGPETPASASALTRLTPPANRPWVFSVRQTGNQIGAMAGSLALPALLAWHAALPFAVVSLAAAAVAGWCLHLGGDARLSPPHPPRQQPDRGAAAGVERAALRRLFGAWPLRLLALAALVYTALQMCLNTFLMSLAVREWHLPVATAAAGVAALQFAGLGGRLCWGWVGQRTPHTMPLLGALGLLMAASGVTLMTAPVLPHHPALAAALVLLLGFTASGWNGVLVAEISRQSGGHDTGALTGAVIMFGYAGLAGAPLAFAGASEALSMAGAFTLLCSMAGAVGLTLLASARAPSHGLPRR
jgi:MFS family permease